MKTIEVKELTKYYKTNKALDCLNFTIEPGKFTGWANGREDHPS